MEQFIAFETPYFLHTMLTIVTAAFASSGFWAFMQRRCDKKDVKTEMLIGLGHDRIIYLGMKYIQLGNITRGEYENLKEYLYKPYERMGGNSSATRIMQEVDKLKLIEKREELIS